MIFNFFLVGLYVGCFHGRFFLCLFLGLCNPVIDIVVVVIQVSTHGRLHGSGLLIESFRACRLAWLATSFVRAPSSFCRLTPVFAARRPLASTPRCTTSSWRYCRCRCNRSRPAAASAVSILPPLPPLPPPPPLPPLPSLRFSRVSGPLLGSFLPRLSLTSPLILTTPPRTGFAMPPDGPHTTPHPPFGARSELCWYSALTPSLHRGRCCMKARKGERRGKGRKRGETGKRER